MIGAGMVRTFAGFAGGTFTGNLPWPLISISVTYQPLYDVPPVPTEGEDLSHNPHYQAERFREFLAKLLRQAVKYCLSLRIDCLERFKHPVRLPRRSPPAVREWKMKLWKQAL